MSASVPVNVIVPSLLPSPWVKLKPVVPLSVIFPCVASSVTRISPPATSRSAMLIAFPLPVEKTRSTSSTMVCATGAEMTGASLTAFTVTLAVAVAALNAVIPPLLLASAVAPAEPLVWSHARKVIPLTVPL
jgi:hypothetical protein